MSWNMQNNWYYFKSHFPLGVFIPFPEISQKCHLALIRCKKKKKKETLWALLISTALQKYWLMLDHVWLRLEARRDLRDLCRQMERKMVWDTGTAELLVVGLELQLYWLTPEMELSNAGLKARQRNLLLRNNARVALVARWSLCTDVIGAECLL